MVCSLPASTPQSWASVRGLQGLPRMLRPPKSDLHMYKRILRNNTGASTTSALPAPTFATPHWPSLESASPIEHQDRQAITKNKRSRPTLTRRVSAQPRAATSCGHVLQFLSFPALADLFVDLSLPPPQRACLSLPLVSAAGSRHLLHSQI